MTIRIVLADDHRLLRDALRAALEREPDLEIVGEAATGLDLLSAMRLHSPDVVVMDIAMPDMNGIEATSRLLVRHPETRVVMLSAHADRRFVTEAIKAGAHAYVTKNSAGTELSLAIRAVTNRQTYLCSEVPQSSGLPTDDVVRPKGVRNGELSRRERQVLQLIAEGSRSARIAEVLSISVNTVEVHRRNIVQKLGLRTTAELTKYAIRTGLTSA